jgi:hypothetical protein
LRDVDIESELVSDELEHLVVARILHEIQTRANVRSILALRDELERE